MIGRHAVFLAPGFRRVPIEADGNCFYRALVESGACPEFSIDSLRAIVASAATEDTLAMLKVAAMSDPASYGWVLQLSTLKELKEALSASSPLPCTSAMKGRVKYRSVVWADDFAVLTVLTKLNLTLLLVGHPPARDLSVVCGDAAGLGTPRLQETRAFILERSRREHYTLISFQGETSWDWKNLPSTLVDMWAIKKRHRPSEETTKRKRDSETIPIESDESPSNSQIVLVRNRGRPKK